MKTKTFIFEVKLSVNLKIVTNHWPTVQVTVSFFSFFGRRIIKHIPQQACARAVWDLEWTGFAQTGTQSLALLWYRRTTTRKTCSLVRQIVECVPRAREAVWSSCCSGAVAIWARCTGLCFTNTRWAVWAFRTWVCFRTLCSSRAKVACRTPVTKEAHRVIAVCSIRADSTVICVRVTKTWRVQCSIS